LNIRIGAISKLTDVVEKVVDCGGFLAEGFFGSIYAFMKGPTDTVLASEPARHSQHAEVGWKPHRQAGRTS
jgi:hypothetical protein